MSLNPRSFQIFGEDGAQSFISHHLIEILWLNPVCLGDYPSWKHEIVFSQSSLCEPLLDTKCFCPSGIKQPKQGPWDKLGCDLMLSSRQLRKYPLHETRYTSRSKAHSWGSAHGNTKFQAPKSRAWNDYNIKKSIQHWEPTSQDNRKSIFVMLRVLTSRST